MCQDVAGDLQTTEDARAVLNDVLIEIQKEVVGFVCGIATELLGHVFGLEYELRFTSSVDRGRPSLTPIIAIGDLECSPRDELGGGVLDVASFGMRLALWAIAHDVPAPVLILDEPGKFLDRERVPLFGEAIRQLANELEVQIIFVTHANELENIADMVYSVVKSRSVSAVERLAG